MKPQVKKSDFINWMFRSTDAKDIQLELADRLIEQLLDKGSAEFSVKEEFDLAGYIPSYICTWKSERESDKHDGEEYDPSECELID